MRCALRYVFTIFSAGSLLVFVIVCVLWVRSYWVSDGIRRGRGLAYQSVQVSRGVVFGGFGKRAPNHGKYDYGPRYVRERPFERVDFDSVLRSTDGGDRDASWRWGGFSHRTRRSAARWWYGWWEAPMWPLAAGMAVLPGVWLRKNWRTRTRERRRASGLCVGCGYDLRAHGAGERCPECGLRQAQSSGATAASSAA